VLSVCDDVCVPCVCVFVCGCVKIVKFNNNKQSTKTAAATNYNSNKKLFCQQSTFTGASGLSYLF
jgi:hypothetical protein